MGAKHFTLKKLIGGFLENHILIFRKIHFGLQALKIIYAIWINIEIIMGNINGNVNVELLSPVPGHLK